MQNNRAFSLVEIIVVVTILAILSLIGFLSFSNNIMSARDSQRINDIDRLQIDLKSHKQKEGSYPKPVTPVNITNSGTIIYQGLLTSDILSNTLTNIPKDPRTSNWYWYSTSVNRQQFQIALTLEDDGSPRALLQGDYKSLTKDLAPTMILAVTGATSFDITANTQKFILNGGSYNLPYDMHGAMVANSTVSFSGLMTESKVLLEVGGNYTSCADIYEVGRAMGSGAYQIINSSGAVTDTSCPMVY